MYRSTFFAIGFLFLISCIESTAQSSSINGIVVEQQTDQPLDYTSVVLLNAQDSSLVAGTLSKEDGSFNFLRTGPGSYTLKFVFLGYDTRYVRNISLSRNQQLDLGKIALTPGSQMLAEVSVIGNKRNTLNKIDKQTYKVDQFESAKGGTAIDVLRNLPSVTVNGQGDISVRGSAGFLVLVNGKPVLSGAENVLSQLGANSIENIELITAPSAKYDPDGKSGIINIITKRGVTDGFSLAANVQGGLPGTTDYDNLEKPIRFGGDVTLNLKKKKWDISIGANYLRNDVSGYREGDVFTKNFTENTITRFPSNGERSFDKYNYAARTSLVYEADKNNIFTLGFYSGKRYQQRLADILYNNSTSDMTTNTIYKQLTYFNSNLQTKEGNFTLFNFDYTHTFKNNSTVTASTLYERAKLYGSTSNKNLNYPAMDQIFQEVYNPYNNPIDGYRLKIDHTVSIGKGKLESGYQFRHDKQNGTFDYIVTPATSEPDAARFSGNVKTTNRINSVYSQFTGNVKKFQYVAGLRYEYAVREVYLSYESDKHYLYLSNLFPSANLLYTFNDSWSIKAAYSKRVQRTNNYELNPIPEREHSETLEQGDPDLLPEYIDLAEAGLNHSFNTGSLFATLYFQKIKNPIQRVNSVYADTILNRLFTNAERARLYGLETGIDFNAARWWKIYAGANIYNYKIDGALNILGEYSSISNKAWVYSVNTNTTFSLGSKWSLQANVNYTSKRPTALGEDSRFLVPGTSIKRTFLAGRCSLSLQWQNINLGFMNSNQQRITTMGDDFFTTTNYIYETDVFLLNFSFNLNKLNSKAKLPSSEIGDKEF